ncbi:hypothetical protein A9179_18630 [Pseudomonas alcaligenes]|uniref:J domain-containing protein n=1 Tax=Aquipseudomonas alcaligenes TaxID=43263 RepID=A0ABR7S3Z7_AQUAC|nr:J domain-containing protein [Pseudomonas alcaligenes]MBC9252291.1 hypothetical protein [Pseudomonas alcaligenes]
MSCWTILGLRADADERAIKRSYAALLKVHRPDEDLDAFQRLREAYEQALAIARRRAEEQDEEAGEDDGLALAAPPVLADTGLLAELERPLQVPDPALQAEAQMLASLSDMAPENLAALASQAKAEERLALFERCLLQRCLEDNEQGYAAAQWALACLGWLTPWQEASLPPMQLDVLVNRLLATELHSLHAQLAEGDEQAFLARVAALHEQDWLQPFDLRSYFNRQLVDILLATRWSPAFFQELCSRCRWDELQASQAGWLHEWDQLQRRGELDGLEQRIRERMALRQPRSGQERAAWLLLKPLRDGQRKRLVDGFVEKDLAACQLLEQTLVHEAPEVLERLAPEGLHDWRKWLPGLDWHGIGFSLWLLLLVPAWFLFYDDFHKKPGDSPLVVALSVAMMAGMLMAGALVLHRVWRLLTGWLTGFDVLLSKMLLPRAWVRDGTGLLLLRHGLPSAALTAATVAMGATQGVVEAVACGITAPLALLYADFTTRMGSPVRVALHFLRRFQRVWNRLLWVVGLSLFALAIYWNTQGKLEKTSLSEFLPAAETRHDQTSDRPPAAEVHQDKASDRPPAVETRLDKASARPPAAEARPDKASARPSAVETRQDKTSARPPAAETRQSKVSDRQPAATTRHDKATLFELGGTLVEGCGPEVEMEDCRLPGALK